jgi:tRNA A37 threonylcarbamoyladenosine dehydratase
MAFSPCVPDTKTPEENANMTFLPTTPWLARLGLCFTMVPLVTQAFTPLSYSVRTRTSVEHLNSPFASHFPEAICARGRRLFSLSGPAANNHPVFPEVSNDSNSDTPPEEQLVEEWESCSALLNDTGETTTEELNSLAPPSSIDDDINPDGDDDLHWFRFGGVGRLYADESREEDQVLDRLKSATVAVVGLGGVGSWTAEALCRSGIGHLVLIDLDDICISNTNRQLHTLATNVGQMKTDIMRQRLVDIHPYCRITLIHDFVLLDNVQEIVGQKLKDQLRVTAVVDAIDGHEEKAALLAACADFGLPVVTCGSPAGTSDPTQIVCQDLTQVEGDSLLGPCRQVMQEDFAFPEVAKDDSSGTRAPWNIPSVYSQQTVRSCPSNLLVDQTSSFRCDGSLGTASFVTGTVGFVAASRIVDMIVSQALVPPTRK